LSLNHPSTDGKAIAKIVKVEIEGDELPIEEWLGQNSALILVQTLKLNGLRQLRVKVNREILPYAL